MSGYKPIKNLTTAIHAQLPENHVEAIIVRIRQISKPSLLVAMIHAFGKPFVAAGFLLLISDSLAFVGPLLLK